MWNKLTRHHIIPTSRGGSNHYNNIAKLKDKPHRGLHTLYKNEMPHEQLQSIIDLTWLAFSKCFIADVTEFLEERTIEEMYNHKCLIDRLINNK